MTVVWQSLAFGSFSLITGASLVAQTVKKPPAMQETQVWSLGQEDPLEKGMAIYSSILAWEVSWTEEPSTLPCMGSKRIGHDQVTNSFANHLGIFHNFCFWSFLLVNFISVFKHRRFLLKQYLKRKHYLHLQLSQCLFKKVSKADRIKIISDIYVELIIIRNKPIGRWGKFVNGFCYPCGALYGHVSIYMMSPTAVLT